MEELQKLQKKLDEIKSELNKEEQKLFSLNSIQNFLTYYNNLTSYQDKVLKLLLDYFAIVEANKGNINKEVSTRIGTDFIPRIGTYYATQLGFKLRMRLDITLFWGILFDLLLLVLGFLKKIHYLPIITVFLLCYFVFVKIFYEDRNKVFDIGY